MGAWLEGKSAAPPKVAASTELQAQLKLQDEVAQKLKEQRFQHGALNLQTDEVHPLVLNDQVVDVVKQQKNRATELIEDFMVAANGVVARLLENVSSLRRIVRTPERWDRIVQLAATKGEKLPAQPDSKALNDFLLRRKAADPDHFADVSLAVIKLIGPGEYVLERPGEPAPGHFGLAVQDYTHSTAPNRRFADVVTQRLIKALLAGQKNPYSDDELTAIAANCTQKENAAKKGRARNVEASCGCRHAAPDRRSLRRHRHRRDRSRNLRSRSAAARRRTACPRPAGTRCGRQASRQAHPHRRAKGYIDFARA